MGLLSVFAASASAIAFDFAFCNWVFLLLSLFKVADLPKDLAAPVGEIGEVGGDISLGERGEDISFGDGGEEISLGDGGEEISEEPPASAVFPFSVVLMVKASAESKLTVDGIVS